MKSKEIQLSAEFKTQAKNAIISIIFFIVTYSIILFLAIIIAGLCITGGIAIMSLNISFITIVLGVGLASVGVFILIFLLKFIFKSHKQDRSHLIEINEFDEPKLFGLIYEIVLEVGTSFPKKVYLSSDVNASVFYDSSFWSMFLPIKKNLQIGIGLVNVVTMEELKSILSHEFGHFSQRSMKLGSYVYNVNQVIFNMLYENESYDNLIDKWANFSGYFKIFVFFAVKINELIQWILKKLYGVVNKSYMALSREMEFHADEIAASITGFEPLKKSLLRLSFGDSTLNNVLNYYTGKIPENIKSDSIYKDQSAVINFLAEVNNIPISNNLPDISLEEQTKYDKSKLVIKDQWASHPTMIERVERLEKTGYISSKTIDSPANEIFSDFNSLEKQLTQKIFNEITYEGQATYISSDVFISEFKKDFLSNSFDKTYNCYYDNKNFTFFDIKKKFSKNTQTDIKDLFSDEKVDWIYNALALQSDIETLKNISNGTFNIKSFDYEGIRYNKKNAEELINKLNVELEDFNIKIENHDINIYNYFITKEKYQEKASKLERLYNSLFDFDKEYESKYEIYVNLLNELQFVSVTTPYEQIRNNFEQILPIESNLKKEIKVLLADKIFNNDLSKDIKLSLEKYLSQVWQYFEEPNYINENLDILNTALNYYAFLLSRKYFLMKKAILTYQIDLLNGQNNITEKNKHS